MELRVSIYGDEYKVVSANLDATNKVFNVDVTSEGKDISIEVDYPLEVKNILDPNDYQIHLLAKNNLLENDIYQVYDKSRECRVGWILPVQSLSSTDHDYSSNEYYLNYAHVVAMKLLTEDAGDVYTTMPEHIDGRRLKLVDFFSDNMAILVISNKTLVRGYTFDLNDWVPSLFVHGYAQIKHRNPEDIVSFGTRPEDKRLYLSPVSTDVKYKEIVNSIYTELLPYEDNSLLAFFYLYQLIELLISTIFEHQQDALITELISSKGDSVKTKDVLDKIRNNQKESERLKSLVSTYTKELPNMSSLKRECNNILGSVGRDEKNEAILSLYNLRNLIFHQFRDIASVSTLASVVDEFHISMAEILNLFTIPK